MAIGKSKTEEHAFKAIQRDLQNGELSSLLLFYGEEEYLVKWAADLIVNRYVDPPLAQLNFAKVNWETSSLSEIISQCETLPMMGERRIVLVEGFPAGNEAVKWSLSEEEEREFTEYIKSLPESCFLIIIPDAVDKRKKLYKAMASCGSIYEFNRLDEGDLRTFIKKRVRAGGKTIEAQAIRRLIERSGYYDKLSHYSLYNLDNDLKKLIALCIGDEIDAELISQGLSDNTESHVFDMIDAISAGRKGDALTILHNLLSSGESIYGLLAMICSQYELILMVKEMGEDGYVREDMAKEIGVHPYRVKLAGDLSHKYSKEKLRKMLGRCFQVDGNIKKGLLEDRLAMEMLIAGL
jgi:DNA polymerase-3 subunit delta